MKTAVIIRNGRIEVYAVPENVLSRLPEAIFDPEEAEEAAEAVEKNGLLEAIIKADYTISLPD